MAFASQTSTIRKYWGYSNINSGIQESRQFTVGDKLAIPSKVFLISVIILTSGKRHWSDSLWLVSYSPNPSFLDLMLLQVQEWVVLLVVEFLLHWRLQLLHLQVCDLSVVKDIFFAVYFDQTLLKSWMLLFNLPCFDMSLLPKCLIQVKMSWLWQCFKLELLKKLSKTF